jgi:hypothetical protein
MLVGKQIRTLLNGTVVSKVGSTLLNKGLPELMTALGKRANQICCARYSLKAHTDYSVIFVLTFLL